MNKKIKIIDLFKMEKFPKKIKGKKDIYILKCKTNSLEHLYEIDCVDACIGWLETEDISLLDEVEILEDNTEEIEELLINLLEKVKNTPDNVIDKAIDSLHEKLRKEKE